MLKSKLEALLFVSAKPISIKQLSEILEVSAPEIEVATDALMQEYLEQERGIQLIKLQDKYQMATKADYGELINKLIKTEVSGELSRPSLETLAIIAYRSPIAKSEIDQIRGLNCTLILRNLLLRGLIEAKDSKDTDEVFYSVTFDFIKFLGLNELKQLPNYELLSTTALRENEEKSNEENISE